MKAGMLIKFEFLMRAPGKRLEVKETEDSFSDILISQDFVNDKGELDSCKHLSLRKSIECTVQEHLCQGKHGVKIDNDGDRDQPHYFLHGWSEPYDPDAHEIWFTHARTATWAAIYGWTAQLPPRSRWTQGMQSINLSTAPEVFGYVYLFEIANPDFYNQQRIARIGALAINSPDHTPETANKIFARYNYRAVRRIGDFPKGDPDAYIFKGKGLLQEAQLRVLHQYRIINPQYA